MPSQEQWGPAPNVPTEGTQGGHGTVHQANTQKFEQLDKQVSGVAAELGKEIDDVRSEIHAQTAGGLGESFMGLAWVAVGTLLSGLTPEVVKLLRWMVT